jgi:hypothetical protein
MRAMKMLAPEALDNEQGATDQIASIKLPDTREGRSQSELHQLQGAQGT